jgi:hypothetical protein
MQLQEMAALTVLSTPSYSSLSAVPACIIPVYVHVCICVYICIYLETHVFRVHVNMHNCSDDVVSAEAVRTALCTAACNVYHIHEEERSIMLLSRVLHVQILLRVMTSLSSRPIILKTEQHD